MSSAHPSSPNPAFTGAVEFSASFAPRRGIRHVLFDWDGTLSLIRAGWAEVMTPMFAEMMPPIPNESDDDRRRIAFEDIMRLNGKQTIYQMIQLAERVRERGGDPREPLWYKHEYLRRLDERIRHRIDALESGATEADAQLVHGARALLENLVGRGLTLHLASGTDEPFVRREADLLDVARYFEGRIHGAMDDYKKFSKKMVIDRILASNRIDGDTLLAFGDGYVEIENTVAVGGLAVAVASDEEHNGSGLIDAWKRERLLGVGAHVVIPDYRDSGALLERVLAR